MSDVYAAPGGPFEWTVFGAAPGAVGVATWSLWRLGDVVIPESTDGIVEVGLNTGVYTIAGDAPNPGGELPIVYVLQFDDGAGGPPAAATLEITASGLGPGAEPDPPAGVYASPAQLRAKLELAEADLDDETASATIRTAERLVDLYLGPHGLYTEGPSAGRKVAQADVEAWIWTELSDATATLASRIYRDPDQFARIFDSVSGPDFRTGKPIGPLLGLDVASGLLATGLVRRTARGR